MRKMTVVLAGLIAAPAVWAGDASAEDWRAKREREALERDKKLSAHELTVFTAEPGRQKVGPMKPTWCHLDKTHHNKRRSGYMSRTMKQFKRGYVNQIGPAAALLCAHPNAPDWNKQTGYFVQGVINMTGQSKKDAIASIVARVQKAKWAKQVKAICGQFEDNEEASEEEKILDGVTRAIFGCRYRANRYPFWQQNRQGDKKLEWYIDRRAEISSELVKVYHVLSCLRQGYGLSTKKKRDLLPYATCGHDARTLNRSALEKELAAKGFNAAAKVIARESFAVAKASAQRYKAVVDKLAKRDPEYGKIFYDVPAAAWKAWVADFNANKAAYEAAYAFEKKLFGPSRRATQGCYKPLRKHFDAYMKSKKVKTKKQFDTLTSEGLGAVLVSALMPCSARDAGYYETYAWIKRYKKTRDTRGPRYAAYYAVIDKIQEIRSDRTRFPLSPKMFWQKFKVSTYMSSMSDAKKKHGSKLHQAGKGQVKKIKRVKGGYKLLFKTVKYKEEQWNCRATNRVRRITGNGNVEYYHDCRSAGFKTMKRTEKPIIIPAHAKAGIKRGSFVVLDADYPFPDKKHKRFGFPIEVYKSKKKKKLVSYYGLKL